MVLVLVLNCELLVALERNTVDGSIKQNSIKIQILSTFKKLIQFS